MDNPLVNLLAGLNLSSNDNKDKRVILVRGLPGSGKSTTAKEILKEYSVAGIKGEHLETDDRFINAEGNYVFEPTKLGEAHAETQRLFAEACANGAAVIIVSNTFVKLWEAKFYVETAQKIGYEIEFRQPETEWWKEKETDVNTLVDKNVHGVSRAVLERMLKDWVPHEKYTADAVLRGR